MCQIGKKGSTANSCVDHWRSPLGEGGATTSCVIRPERTRVPIWGFKSSSFYNLCFDMPTASAKRPRGACTRVHGVSEGGSESESAR